MSITGKISGVARSIKRRLTRATAAIFVSGAGVVIVAVGITGWSEDLAVIWVGAWIMLYGFLFIDLDVPSRRGRQQ